MQKKRASRGSHPRGPLPRGSRPRRSIRLALFFRCSGFSSKERLLAVAVTDYIFSRKLTDNQTSRKILRIYTEKN